MQRSGRGKSGTSVLAEPHAGSRQTITQRIDQDVGQVSIENHQARLRHSRTDRDQISEPAVQRANKSACRATPSRFAASLPWGSVTAGRGHAVPAKHGAEVEPCRNTGETGFELAGQLVNDGGLSRAIRAEERNPQIRGRLFSLKYPWSEPAVNHDAHRHLQDGSHASVSPLFRAADRDKENISILKHGVGGLIGQNLLQGKVGSRFVPPESCESTWHRTWRFYSCLEPERAPAAP